MFFFFFFFFFFFLFFFFFFFFPIQGKHSTGLNLVGIYTLASANKLGGAIRELFRTYVNGVCDPFNARTGDYGPSGETSGIASFCGNRSRSRLRFDVTVPLAVGRPRRHIHLDNSAGALAS